MREFIHKSRLKPWDAVIIVFLILMSFLPVVIFGWQEKKLAEQTDNVTYEAVLSVDGQEIKSFPLVAGAKSYTYRYEDADGDYNLIAVDGRRIRIVEASCGDQVCVQRGWIEKSKETIVCLPHKLIIEVIASDGSQDGNLIY